MGFNPVLNVIVHCGFSTSPDKRERTKEKERDFNFTSKRAVCMCVCGHECIHVYGKDTLVE